MSVNGQTLEALSKTSVEVLHFLENVTSNFEVFLMLTNVHVWIAICNIHRLPKLAVMRSLQADLHEEEPYSP